MKSMKEFQEQHFNKEEVYDDEELDCPSRRNEEIIKNISDEISFEEFEKFIELFRKIFEPP